MSVVKNMLLEYANKFLMPSLNAAADIMFWAALPIKTPNQSAL
jgi:hypothetical protein